MTEQEAYGISKMEEQFGLQLIIKKLVPNAVRIHNNKARHSEDIIDVKDAIRKLRKTKDEWDEKIYQSKTFAGTLTFGISKRHQASHEDHERGVLCVGDYNLTTTRMWYWYATDELQSGALYNLKEGTVYCRLTKIQEQEGLQFILRHLVKKAVDVFNKHVFGYEYDVTPKEVAKNLKKIVDYRPPDDPDQRFICDMVAYGSVINRIRNQTYPEGLKFRFDVSVDDAGDLMASFTTPLSNIRSYYHVHKPLTEATHEDVKNFGISKKEEDFGYQLIIKNIVPQAVGEYNELVDRHNSGLTVKYKIITHKEAIRNLRKVKREYDMVQYASKQDYTTIEFGIRKKRYPISQDDIPQPQLAIGYWQLFPPVYHRDGWRWYPVDNFIGSEEDENPLNENEDGPFHISKEEEDKALEYIIHNFSKDFTQRLGRKLKKVRHVKGKDADIIQYSAWIDGYWVGFTVKKIEDYDELKLMVARTFKGQEDADVWFNIPIGDPQPQKPWSFLEEIIGSQAYNDKTSISKLEEDQALDFIRKVVLLKAVEQYNREIKTNPYAKYSNYKPVNVADVSRNLRKIAVWKYDNNDTKAKVTGSDVIEYESKIPIGHVFGFRTDKVNGELYTSYESPFDMTRHSFKVGGYYL